MFAMNMALANARRGILVDIWSLEMSRNSMYQRWLQLETGVDSGKIRRGELEEEDWKKLRQRRVELPLYINSEKAVSLSEIMKVSTHRILSAGTGLIIIDYTQLVNGIGGWKKLSYSPNREQMLSTIVYGIGDLREHNVGLCIVAQLNKENNYRETEAFQQASDVCVKMVSPDSSTYSKEDIEGYFDILNRHDEGDHLHYLFRRAAGKFLMKEGCDCN
jgi:replicative DNA helicase